MLDIHTHLLPAVDDGAKDLATSLSLCRTLHTQGITEAIVTPHWCSPRFEVHDPKILAAWEKLTAAVAQEIPGLRLHLGAEHHCSGLQPVPAFIASLHPLGKSRCVLIEFPDDQLPANAWATLHAVCQAGYKPFIAHPERCKGLAGKYRELKAFIDFGGRLQLDLGNALGAHGLMMRWRSSRLLAKFRSGCILASDCHNQSARKPLWDRLPAKWADLVPRDLADLATR